VNTRSIDPRTINELPDTTDYVVIFWEQSTDVPEGADAGYAADEWYLDSVSDLREVLDWIDARLGSRSFELFAGVPSAHQSTGGPAHDFTRLAGTNPTAGQ
jgi:hypothetical protein